MNRGGVRQCFPVGRPWCLVKCLMWALVVFVQIHEHDGCLEEERIGLLRLKAFLKSNASIGDPILPTWIDEDRDEMSSDCCGWERVLCNSTTGHIIQLSLHHIQQDDIYTTWLLNVFLFRPFKELKSLELSGNQIDGCIANEGFERLAVLTRLEVLNLASNFFDDSILSSGLTQLSSLTTLVLADNYFEEFQGLSKLSKLKHLDLSYNRFKKQILRLSGQLPTLKSFNLGHNFIEGPLSIKDLENLSRLEILDMSGNWLTGSISPYLGALSSAKAISLSDNYFNGDFPTLDLCRLKKLEEFDISSNDFEGILPRCISNMPSLRMLDISNNRFIGNLSSSLVASLNPTVIEYIDLSQNLFEGMFSFSLFANHSKLEVVRFTSGNNKFEIETENPMGWTPLFQLMILVLQNCNLNKLTGNVPKFLVDQHRLKVVDFSHNKLKGSFPF